MQVRFKSQGAIIQCTDFLYMNIALLLNMIFLKKHFHFLNHPFCSNVLGFFWNQDAASRQTKKWDF